jgi:hypothetical protein
VILAAPCCHHNIQAQLRRSASPRPYSLVTRHGILRERFADALTDAIARLSAPCRLSRRRRRVRPDPAHTPRNVLIRAVRTGAPPTAQLIEEYAALAAMSGPYGLIWPIWWPDHLPQQLR